MTSKAKVLAVLIFAWSSLQTVYADPMIQGVVIEAIEGGKTITVSQAGKKRDAKVGDIVANGERILTQNNSVTIAYPEGSKVIITKNTDFAVEKEIEGVQWNKLRKGTVRGIIQKIAIPNNNKPRFLIRTKSAVLGVRGTDFVMAMNAVSGNAQVHTLEGLVDVARNEVSLMSGQSAHVAEGQFLQANPMGVSPTQSFDKSEFLRSFNEKLGTPSSRAPASEGSSASSAGESASSPSANQSSAPSVSDPSSAPTIAPPSKFRVPERPESLLKDDKNEENKKAEAMRPTSESESRFKLIAFQAGFFFAQLPTLSSIAAASPVMENVRAATVSWTPTIPVPILSFLSLRGNIGGSFALQGSLNNNFLVKELQLFLTLNLFNLAYAEVGTGKQFWQGYRNFSGQLNSVNAGLLFRVGLIDRIFIGYQNLNIDPRFDQYKAGVGLSF